MTTSPIPAQWFALTVRPNHEKTAAQALENKNLEVLLPLYRARRRWSDRTKDLELPLFAGYVFGRFTASERTRVLSTPGVTSVVGFGNKPAAVSDAEIASIRTLMASGLPLSPWPFLRVGQRVRIEAGPLAGVEGILSQVKDSWRVVVNVEILQRSVAAEVERDAVAAVLSSGAGQSGLPATRTPRNQHARL